MVKVTPFKNYTTGIAVAKTVMEIEEILAQNKATRIIKDYDHEGNINSLSFGLIVKIAGETQLMPIKLPANVENVNQALIRMQRSGKIRNVAQYRTMEHAGRVAWRNVKDWLLAQMALIQAEQTEIPQIFLPYAYNDKLGKTYFEMIEEGNVNIPMLEGANENTN